VATGKQPPSSRYSSLANHSLVAPAAVAFPVIPCITGLSCGPDGKAANVTGPNSQGGVWNTRTVWNRGSHYNATDVSGTISTEPPTAVAQYPTLVPQVDADGNDIDGLRSVTLRAPLGTYAGWNVRKMGYSQGDSCDLNGEYIPFAGTRADRIKTGDRRLSLQERYGNAAGYLQAATSAADQLVSQGLLLQADEKSAINCAVNQAAQAAQLAVQQGSALIWGAPAPLPACPAP
jgi:hypothetical protein